MARGNSRVRVVTRACRVCDKPFDVNKMQCPHCRAWNAAEEAYSKDKDGTVLLSEAEDQVMHHVTTGPWDPCFGETVDDNGETHTGIVAGTTALVGGAPGAGKSTLSIQIAGSIIRSTGKEILYIATEEANAPIRSRAKRLGFGDVTNKFRMVPIGTDPDLAAIMLNRQPVAIILDSLSKACPDPADAITFAKHLKDYCLKLNAPGILIDHVTKDEDLAGFMALQHEVDSTLLFTVYEDDVRELKTLKNRNGPTRKMCFNMTELGLVYRDPEEDEEEDEDG